MKSTVAIGVFALMWSGIGCAASPPLGDEDAARPTVVLLHGLARRAASMDRMAQALSEAGYHVCNVGYPSREHAIADLAAQVVAPAVAACAPNPVVPVNFVTHSMGGIIVRELARAASVQTLGRVVMLGPPNQGSEVVDALGGWALFAAINGPAGGELGTSETSAPNLLGKATFEVGVVAGNRSINWINSLMIPGADDGKVSVSNTKLEGMQDFIVLHTSHPFLMKDRDVIEHTLHFLSTGCFAHEEAPLTDLLPCNPDVLPSLQSDAATVIEQQP